VWQVVRDQLKRTKKTMGGTGGGNRASSQTAIDKHARSQTLESEGRGGKKVRKSMSGKESKELVRNKITKT